MWCSGDVMVIITRAEFLINILHPSFLHFVTGVTNADEQGLP